MNKVVRVSGGREQEAGLEGDLRASLLEARLRLV